MKIRENTYPLFIRSYKMRKELLGMERGLAIMYKILIITGKPKLRSGRS